ncbi:pyridoxamine 5'-phosphate oxidase family protein [Staphylococcus warneri]|uniref:pyridoxamine 5'-phosphate oxidase family protein n=1 Tax=Staphylococcus warneri TaxID=1292 RepID=UPI0032619793
MVLSNEIIELLNGTHLDQKQHVAMMLQSTTEEGYPHSAMISVGEIVALNEHQVRIALWPDTTTTRSLMNFGKANLVIVYKHKVNYIELDVQSLNKIGVDASERMCFQADVKHFKEDVAKYADITSGITFDLKEPEKVLQRWQSTIDELKQL